MQGVMKFIEGVIFTGSAPSRASAAVASRAHDNYTVADLAAAYDQSVSACVHVCVCVDVAGG